MKRLATAIVAAVLMLTLVGCGNKDPKMGSVVTASSNCLFGECWTKKEICKGPDLIESYLEGWGESDGDWEIIHHDDPKCK